MATEVLPTDLESQIEIREVRPADQESLAQFYGALSDDSRRARFLGFTSGISGTAAGSFCTLDHVHDQGFVALVPEGDATRVVGHVCLVQTGPDQLELGIAVAEGQQGRGLGRRLFESAMSWARARHFTTITASCLADNSRVLALLSSAPFGARASRWDAGIVEVTIPLQAPIDSAVAKWPPGAKAARRRARQHGATQPVRVWRQPSLGR